MIYGYLVGFVIEKIEKRTSLYRKRIFEMIRERSEEYDETLEEAALKVLEYFHIKLNDEEKKIVEKLTYQHSEKTKRRVVDYKDNSFYYYNQISRCWGVKKEPWRQFIFLGTKDKQPCFLLLFAKHEYEKELRLSENSILSYNQFRESVLQKEYPKEMASGRYKVLSPRVQLQGYYILKGENGRLPILDTMYITTVKKKRYGYMAKKYGKIASEKYILNKKGFSKKYYRFIDTRRKKSALREEIMNFEHNYKIFFQYFNILEDNESSPKTIKTYPNVIDYYEDPSIIQEVQMLELKGYEPYKSIEEFLGIEQIDHSLKTLLGEFLLNPDLYERKKALTFFLSSNPSKELMLKLIKRVSSSLLCGIFYELAKFNNDLLRDEAETISSLSDDECIKQYGLGVKRHAMIYLTSIDKLKRQKRIKQIHQTFIEDSSDITNIKDEILQLVPIEILDAVDYSEDKITANYLFANRIKHFVQEIDLYGLPSCLGKLAVYIDSSIAKEFSTAFNIYISRFIRRLIDYYAKENVEYYYEFIESFFKNYKSCYVSNSQLLEAQKILQFNCRLNEKEKNKLLLYLTSMVTEKQLRTMLAAHKDNYSLFGYSPIRGINHKKIRVHKNVTMKFQLIKEKFTLLIEIFKVTDIAYVQLFVYSILKKHHLSEFEKQIEKFSLDQLFKLSTSKQITIKQHFREILEKKIRTSRYFTKILFLDLLESSDNYFSDLAYLYLETTKPYFSPELLFKLLEMDFDLWGKIFKDKLLETTLEDYTDFILILFDKREELQQEQFRPYLNEIQTTIGKLQSLPKHDLSEIIQTMINYLLHERYGNVDFVKFIESVIFSFSYEDLESICKKIKFDHIAFSVESDRTAILSLLHFISIAELPPIDYLDYYLINGTPAMVKKAIELVNIQRDALNENISLLIFLLESKIGELYAIGQSIVEKFSKSELEKLLPSLIDSPSSKANEYAISKIEEIYGETIPEVLLAKFVQHPSRSIKSYLSKKIDQLIKNIESGHLDPDTFFYYVKTIVYLPNLCSKSKDRMFHILPFFVSKYENKRKDVESILLEIGGSNVIIDSERALTALAKIRMGVTK